MYRHKLSSSSSTYERQKIFTNTVLSFTPESIKTHSDALQSLDKNTLTLQGDQTSSSSSSYQNSSVENYKEYFLPLILEESRAVLQQGLEKITLNRTPPSEMSVTSSEGWNANKFTFKGPLSLEEVEGARTHIVLLIQLPSSHQKILALANVTNFGKIIDLDVEMGAEHVGLARQSLSDDKPTLFNVWVLCSLVSQARMYEACSNLSSTHPFLENLSRGIIAALPTEVETLPYQRSAAEIAAFHRLNPSQTQAIVNALALNSGIQLLQGPPGTGKTTTIIALAEALVSTPAPSSIPETKKRLLVCAPSNKAVQVIAKRLLKILPSIPLILAGVEKKLDPALQPIFLHTWVQQQLQAFDALIHHTKSYYLNEQNYHGFFADLSIMPAEFDRIKIALEKIKAEIKFRLPLYFPMIFQDLNASFSSLRFSYGSTPVKLIDDRITDCKNVAMVLSEPQKWGEIKHYFDALKKTNVHEEFPSLKKKQTFKTPPSKQEREEISKPLFLEQYNSVVKNLIDDVESCKKRLDQKSKEHYGNDLEVQLLNHAQIILCTLTTAGRSNMLKMDKVDILIIDEAGQAVEAETLIPFQHLNEEDAKIILVGDVNQLPATVISTHAVKWHYDWSMLWRLQEEHQQPHALLTVQYRMEPDIRQWPSQTFYANRLTDGENILMRPKPRFKEDPSVFGYKLVNIRGQEKMRGKSFSNQAESQAIYDQLHYLITQGLVDKNTTVGIISFYQGQVFQLNEKLAPFFDKIKLSISTVDGFQGEECDMIIISAVRANQRQAVGFTTDFRRLNVAITRAKFSLIIFCNIATFENTCTSEGAPIDMALLIQDAKSRPGVFYEQEAYSRMQIINVRVQAPFPSRAVGRKNSNSMFSEFPTLTSSASASSSSHSVPINTGWSKKTTIAYPSPTRAHLKFSSSSSSSSSASPSILQTTRPDAAVEFGKSRRKCSFFQPGVAASCRKGNDCTFVHAVPKQ